MAKKIVFVSGKGGVGKSTLCTATAKALSENGKNVLIEEADSGFGCIDIMLGLENEVVYNLQDIIDKKIDFEKAVVKSENYPLLNYIPAPYNIDFSPTDEQIKNFHKSIDDKFDFILIDMGFGINDRMTAFFKNADLFLMILTPDLISVRDSEKMANFIRELNTNEIRTVINKVHTVGKNAMEDFDKIIDKTGLRLIGIIPYSKSFSKGAFPGKHSLWHKCVNNLCLRLNNLNINLAIM